MKYEKIVIFGKNGFIANHFSKFYNIEISNVDITDITQVYECILKNKPKVVINCAGKTGRPNIDWCVFNEKNRQETFVSNCIAPAMISSCCKIMDCKFVHLSSGCLWENGFDIDELIEPNPPSFYSKTKSDCEKLLDRNRDLIIRLRMPFDGLGGDRCTVSKILKYKKIISEENSFTYIPDLINATNHLISNNYHGIFNVVNNNSISCVEIIELYKQYVNQSHSYEIITNEYLTKNICLEKRSNCTLSTNKLESTGFNMPDVRIRMIEAILNYVK